MPESIFSRFWNLCHATRKHFRSSRSWRPSWRRTLRPGASAGSTGSRLRRPERTTSSRSNRFLPGNGSSCTWRTASPPPSTKACERGGLTNDIYFSNSCWRYVCSWTTWNWSAQNLSSSFFLLVPYFPDYTWTSLCLVPSALVLFRSPNKIFWDIQSSRFSSSDSLPKWNFCAVWMGFLCLLRS